MHKLIRNGLACLFVVLTIAMGSGCSRHLRVDVRASSCLNPVNLQCVDDARDSRPLRVRAYPLKGCPEPKSLKWEAFMEEGKDREQLADLWLSGPQEFEIERLLTHAIDDTFPWKTRCFLLVAIGRAEGAHSLEPVRFRLFHRSSAVTLEHYNIYVDDPAVRASQEIARP